MSESKKIMEKYYVNKNVQANGDHEVHKESCVYLPSPENSVYLGNFTICYNAIEEAKKHYEQVNGCYSCSNQCHSSDKLTIEDLIEGRLPNANLLPNKFHDSVLTFLLDYRREHPEFTFWLRERNTNNRLNEGYWFQGTDNYAFVGFYKASGGNASTRSVGLVFWPNSPTEYGVSFEVIFRHEKDEKRLNFYQKIRDYLETDFEKKFEVRSEYQYRIILGYDNAFQRSLQFLDEYKKMLDEFAAETGVQDILITPFEFEEKLAKTLSIRDKILSNEPSSLDVEESTEELEEEKELEDDIRLNVANLSQIRIGEATEPAIGAKELAQEVAEILKQLKSEKGMMLGLFGQWGRGKTFLFNLIWDELKSSNKHYRVDFHSWKYQDTFASWGYLYESFASAYYGQKPIGKLKRIIRLNYFRSSKWTYWFFLVTIIIVFVTLLNRYLPTLNSIYLLYFSPILSLIPIAINQYKKYSSSAKAIIKKYTSRFAYDNLLGIQAEIQKEMKVLLKAWIPLATNEKDQKKVLLFVDDIDRCGEERIIQVVDSLRVMLEDEEISKKVIVVAAIDQRILRRAIRLKYQKLLSSETDQSHLNSLITEYMDKLFIASVHLNTLNSEERVKIFRSLISGRVLDFPKRTLTEHSTASRPIPKVSKSQGKADKNIVKNSTTNSPIFGANTLQKHDLKEKLEPTKEIEQFEQILLEEGIKKLDNATPRNIRIFYFRYILAKNFIKRLKGNLQWGNDSDIKLVVDLIVFLSNSDLISNNVRKLLNESIDIQEYASIEDNEQFPNHHPDYIRRTLLLQYQKLSNDLKDDIASVLEMVVAY